MSTPKIVGIVGLLLGLALTGIDQVGALGFVCSNSGNKAGRCEYAKGAAVWACSLSAECEETKVSREKSASDRREKRQIARSVCFTVTQLPRKSEERAAAKAACTLARRDRSKAEEDFDQERDEAERRRRSLREQVVGQCNLSLIGGDKCERTEAQKYCGGVTTANACRKLKQRCNDLVAEIAACLPGVIVPGNMVAGEDSPTGVASRPVV